jgi:hypothetical protein
VPPPSPADYAEIWRKLCAARGIPLPSDLVPFLEETYYRDGRHTRAGYHPGYLLDQVAAICRYQGIEARIDRTLVQLAWKNLYAT